MKRPAWRLALTLSMAVSGCGPAAAPRDGGADAGGDAWQVAPPAAPAEPAPPESPAVPRLRSWTCPAGWNPVVVAGTVDEAGDPFSWCTPPRPPRLRLGEAVTPLDEGEEEGERPICDPAVDGTFPVLGLEGCQPLGDECPRDGFPEVPSTVPGARIFVLSGSVAGDGTEGAPFGSIGEAVEAAEAGDVVVIGAGTYREPVVVDRDLTLWGRCVGDTVIDAPPPWAEGSGAVTVLPGTSVTVRNLTVTGALQGVHSRGDVTLEGVWVHAATDVGVGCWAGHATLDHVLVDSTAPAPTHAGDSGYGLFVAGEGAEAAASVSASVFEGLSCGSVVAYEQAATASLGDVLIRNPRFDPSCGFTVGLEVSFGASASARRLVVEGQSSGVEAWGCASSAAGTCSQVELEDAAIGRPGSSAEYVDAGLLVADGGRVVARRLSVDSVEDSGLCALPSVGPPPAFDVEDLVVIARQAEGRQRLRTALDATSSEVSVRRAYVSEAGGGALWLAGSEATLEDLLVRDTEPFSGLGDGISITDGGATALVRVRIERSVGAGVSLLGPGAGESASATLTVEDLAVVDTRTDDEVDLGGYGILLQGPARVSGRRVSVSGNLGVGLFLSGDDTTADLTDVTASRTSPEQNEFAGGDGIGVGVGAVLTLARALVDDNSSAGVSVVGTGSEATISDLVVLRTLQNDAADTPGGAGLALWDGARATLLRAFFEENDTVGIRLDDPGTFARGEDVRVVGSLGTFASEGDTGGGLVVVAGASLELSRAVVADNVGFGALASGAGTSLSLVDAVVRDTRAEGDRGSLGFGLALLDGAAFAGLRLLLERNRAFGVLAFDASSLEVRDALVRDTLASASDARFGRGLEIEGATAVSLGSCRFEGNRDIAIAAFGDRAELSLSEVAVRSTLERSCVALPEDDPASCTTGRGHGLGAYDAASLRVDGLEISSCPEAGLQLARDATIEGEELRLLGNGIAVSLSDMPPDFSLEAFVAGLLLEGNGRDVDGSGRALPERLEEP